MLFVDKFKCDRLSITLQGFEQVFNLIYDFKLKANRTEIAIFEDWL